MANKPAKTPIQNKYAQQYADDLAANRKEQGDITTQITGLQERLEQLKVEESWLDQAQGSLPVTAAPNEPHAAAVAEEPPAAKPGQPESSAPAGAITDAPTTVPQPRQDQSVKVEKSKVPAKKAAAAKKTTAKKTAARKAMSAKNTAARTKTMKKAAAKKPVAGQTPAPEATTTEAPAKRLRLRRSRGRPCGSSSWTSSSRPRASRAWPVRSPTSSPRTIPAGQRPSRRCATPWRASSRRTAQRSRVSKGT